MNKTPLTNEEILKAIIVENKTNTEFLEFLKNLLSERNLKMLKDIYFKNKSTQDLSLELKLSEDRIKQSLASSLSKIKFIVGTQLLDINNVGGSLNGVDIKKDSLSE